MEEILKTFLDAIEEKSWKEIDSLAMDFGQENSEKTEQTRAQVMRQVETYRQKELSEIAQQQRLNADACREESRKRLLEFRTECADEAGKALLGRLHAFVGSDEYPKHLCRLLNRGLEALQASEAVVLLRAEDKCFSDELRRAANGIPLEIDEGAFSIGGLIVEAPALGRRADFSFDTALEDAQKRFGEIFGLGLS